MTGRLMVFLYHSAAMTGMHWPHRILSAAVFLVGAALRPPLSTFGHPYELVVTSVVVIAGMLFGAGLLRLPSATTPAFPTSPPPPHPTHTHPPPRSSRLPLRLAALEAALYSAYVKQQRERRLRRAAEEVNRVGLLQKQVEQDFFAMTYETTTRPFLHCLPSPSVQHHLHHLPPTGATRSATR